jgi:hypothetical protein
MYISLIIAIGNGVYGAFGMVFALLLYKIVLKETRL